MARTRKKSLAVPFVLTISALPGCQGASTTKTRSGCEPPECHMNPPPQPEPTSTATTAPTSTSTATATTAPTSSAPLAVAGGPKWCTETGDKKPCVRKGSGGKCLLFEDDGCPPNAKCNPPPPPSVACPSP